jgi:hypothetical protein
LDGYTVDRVVDFFFDTSDPDNPKLKANLFVGGSDSVPPDVDTDVPVAIVDQEDVLKIWDAASQLANVSNVETNRAYNSLADSGRYILTSVDGASTINFYLDIDDGLQDTVDAAAAVLSDAETTLLATETQKDAAQNSVSDLIQDRDNALTAWNDAITDPGFNSLVQSVD